MRPAIGLPIIHTLMEEGAIGLPVRCLRRPLLAGPAASIMGIWRSGTSASAERYLHVQTWQAVQECDQPGSACIASVQSPQESA